MMMLYPWWTFDTGVRSGTLDVQEWREGLALPGQRIGAERVTRGANGCPVLCEPGPCPFYWLEVQC